MRHGFLRSLGRRSGFRWGGDLKLPGPPTPPSMVARASPAPLILGLWKVRPGWNFSKRVAKEDDNEPPEMKKAA